MRRVKLFVTGGAGYIGSHFVKSCYENTSLPFKPEILIYDDLSRGAESNVLYGDLEIGTLDDRVRLKKALNSFKPDIVVHFAAYIQVGESEDEPWMYFKNNTENTLGLLRLIEEEKIPHFIFSSTAAVYGNDHPRKPLKEEDTFSPVSVYGLSKAMVDQILTRSMAKLPFRFVTFRYFNVCGADPLARIGQDPKHSTHLITKALEVALGRLDVLPIYGSNYDTPDGTCIRDYIHVEDLVNAHILGLEWLLEGKESHIFNLGSGMGYSVQEVVQVVNDVVGHAIPVQLMGRRPGDPDFLVASPQKAERLLKWDRQYDLKQMITHAYAFQKKR